MTNDFDERKIIFSRVAKANMLFCENMSDRSLTVVLANRTLTTLD